MRYYTKPMPVDVEFVTKENAQNVAYRMDSALGTKDTNPDDLIGHYVAFEGGCVSILDKEAVSEKYIEGYDEVTLRQLLGCEDSDEDILGELLGDDEEDEEAALEELLGDEGESGEHCECGGVPGMNPDLHSHRGGHCSGHCHGLGSNKIDGPFAAPFEGVTPAGSLGMLPGSGMIPVAFMTLEQLSRMVGTPHIGHRHVHEHKGPGILG